ncbi:MAG: hypothetical protein ACYC5N_00420, partial [Endomicrobiales bacterium]
MGIELHPFDVVSAVAVVAAAVCLCLLARTGKHRLFVFWRAAVILLLLVLAFQPEIVRSTGDRRPLLAVAVDVSESMKLSGRVSSAEYFIKNVRGELEKKFRLKWYAFASGSAAMGKPQDLRSLRCGNTTDISRSLREIRREGGESLAGILLLSDGNHTGPPPPETWLSELDVPVFSAAPGTGKKIRDIAVVSLRVSDFAFKNTPLEIIARVKATGCAGEKTSVNLR